ncbi:FxSxx-COOH system tetratricopeptide repeat protein [Streptomyces sp. HNM0574]|uniref:FxSxx-COOH system tetratricopeptide repeat protein n=1 Tax=Streptomyces sp. HNM0574 TaxID=2714954 RepID=UPI001469E431|nr:FxSxx-COOH system tetratricopeptide repeat protein [Streptomyces sp. HNM0574]NLU67180.1 tetratricopeptide repeat protein [Streptomyces sp. HNM0574]
MQHFTISYAGAGRAWAAWIGDQLALQDHTFSLHRWDPPGGLPLDAAYRSLVDSAEHLVLLLDDWYFSTGEYTEEEWTRALTGTVVPHLERVTVINVASQELPHTAAALRPVSLLNLDEREARRRMFTAMGLDTTAIETLTESGAAPAHRFPSAPPAVWQAPRRNRRFTGRERYLETLYRRLNSTGDGTSLVALHGVQGVGKSQIADEYLHRFGNEYDIVWHVNAERRTQARQQVALLADRLGLRAGAQLGEQIRGVHEALRTGAPHRRWLIVLDGAEDPAMLVDDVIPEGRGHVLLTTRNTEWGQYGAELVEVTHFDRAESVSFVKRRSKRLTDRQAAELASEMEDFPLLLDQTAAWLARNPTMEVQEYLGLVRQGDINVETDAGYPHTFDKAWAVTFNGLKEEDPVSYELLCLLAFFAPDSIPVRLLRTARAEDLPAPLGDLIADPSEWNATLRKLREAAAIRIEYEDHLEHGDNLTVRDVRMHRVYQALVKRYMGEESRSQGAASASRLLAAADPREPGDRANWSRYDELVPHLESSGALVSDDPVVHGFVLNCIEYLRANGEYKSGWWLCREFVQHLRGRLEPTDPRLLEGELQHANMLRRMGRYQDAEEVGRQIVRSLENGPARPVDRMRAQDGLAGSLMGLARYEEAHDLFAREAEAATAEFGPTMPRTLFARSNLGIAQSLRGRYDDALATHGGILDAVRGQLGERHPMTLYATLHYAWTLRLLGRYDEAESVQNLNVHLSSGVLDKHHEQTLHAEHNLALCLRRTGQAERAESLMRGVVTRTRRKLGPHHPRTLMVEADLAMLLRQHGEAEEARKLAHSTSGRYRAHFGEDHPYAIGTHGNWGLTLWGTGDVPGALTVAEDAYERMGRAVGATHPWTLGCGLNVIGARHLTGEDDAAARLAEELLPHAERTLGEVHPLSLNFRSAHVRSLRELGDSQAEDKARLRMMRIAAGHYGEEHAFTRGLHLRVMPYWDFEPQPL